MALCCNSDYNTDASSGRGERPRVGSRMADAKRRLSLLAPSPKPRKHIYGSSSKAKAKEREQECKTTLPKFFDIPPFPVTSSESESDQSLPIEGRQVTEKVKRIESTSNVRLRNVVWASDLPYNSIAPASNRSQRPSLMRASKAAVKVGGPRKKQERPQHVVPAQRYDPAQRKREADAWTPIDPASIREPYVPRATFSNTKRVLVGEAFLLDNNYLNDLWGHAPPSKNSRTKEDSKVIREKSNALAKKRDRRSKRSAETDPTKSKPLGRQESAGIFSVKRWLSDFFAAHCESQPDKDRRLLPAHFTKLEVYKLLLHDRFVEEDDARISNTHFLRIWERYFTNVKIPATNRFGSCPQCEHFKSLRDKGVTVLARAIGAKLLSKHLEQQKQERDKLADHKKKCYKFPEKYMGIVIDDMDQAKTSLLHWYRVPKNADPNYFIHVHLVGALIFNGDMKSRVFLTYLNSRNDGNLTVTIIQTIIREFVGTLPQVLFLQLDNTAWENKNNLLMSYLHFLVATKVFQKVKINFLLVGHTHDQIDQMFSRFSKKVSRTKAFTLVFFLGVISESYTPVPIITMLSQAYDWRRFALTDPRIVVHNMHNLSFSHSFIIKFKDPSNKVLVQWSKKLSTDTVFGPDCPIYVGNYKNPHALELERENMEADMKDLEVGTMICILATECPDNRPFWLARIDQIKSFLEDGTPENIFITWFACSKGEENPFLGKYCEEISEDRSQRSKRWKKKRKQKATSNKQELNISEMTVLSYNFILTTMRTMFKTTVLRIQAKLSEVDDS